MRNVLIGLVAALLAACTADIPNGVLACDRDNDCPTGFSCHSDGLCYDEPESNAGTGGSGGTGASDAGGTGGTSGTSGTGGDEMDAGREDAGPDASADSSADANDASDGYVAPSCEVDNGGCDDNAMCTVVDAGIVCTCNTDYEGNGETCTKLPKCADEVNGGCDTAPMATCNDATNEARTCDCPDLYNGNGIGPDGCTMDDPCLTNNGGCNNLATCIHNPGAAPTCDCPTGYTGNGVGNTGCTDINECTANMDNCHANAACTNTTGSFTCACNSGFRGNGTTCTACDTIPNCQSGVTCSTANNETCGTCAAGYTGDGTPTCTACGSGTWESTNNTCTACANVNNCSAQETCNVTNGSNVICPTCNAGFRGNGSGTCTACTAIPNCASGLTCTTNSNSTCGACAAGYTLSGGNVCTPTLTGLVLTGGTLSPTFASGTLAYTTQVSLITQTITLRPTAPAGATISITFNGTSNAVTSGNNWVSPILALNANPAIEIVVTASGQTRRYTVTPTRGQQEAYVKASNTETIDSFGFRIALSGDGTRMVVGAPNEDSAARVVNGNEDDNLNTASTAGAAYVFVHDGSVWRQEAYLKPSNLDVEDYFGVAVAISTNGDTIAVGANGEDGSGPGLNGNPADNNVTDTGAAYVFVRNGAFWTQQAYVKASNSTTGADDRFGQSVALSSNGNTLAVGAYHEDSGAALSGAVYVYTRGGGTEWDFQAYLKASNPGVEDGFGTSITLADDGSTLAVGAYGEDGAGNSVSGGGAVYVFTRTGTTWSEPLYLKAPTPQVGGYFGHAVELSGNGNILAIGAHGEDGGADNGRGAVYVVTRSGGTWGVPVRVTASNAESGDRFGVALALSGDGNTLAVCADGEDALAFGLSASPVGNDSATNSGAVYVFARSGTTWNQHTYVKASNTGADDAFGYRLSLSDDGRVLVTGTPYEDSNATGIDGNQGSNSAANSGAVYVFR